LYYDCLIPIIAADLHTHKDHPPSHAVISFHAMIRTIHDHRGAAESQAEACSSTDQIKDEDDDSLFTVARAGFLQLKLQALDNALTRVPMDQHKKLRLNDIVQSIHPRTYVSGSEQVYFLVKDLSWPSMIPQVFINAYEEVLSFRPFTNNYIQRPRIGLRPLSAMPVSSRFAPTFSAIRPLLREIDASCHTKLSNFFDQANCSGMYFLQFASTVRF
jgi:hypothetical protein